MAGLPHIGSGTSLDLPGGTARRQLKPEVKKFGGTGRGQSFFDPFAFAPVTGRGSALDNWDCGLFRELDATESWKIQFHAETFISQTRYIC